MKWVKPSRSWVKPLNIQPRIWQIWTHRPWFILRVGFYHGTNTWSHSGSQGSFYHLFQKWKTATKKKKKHCPQVKIQDKMWQNIFEFSREFAKKFPQKGYLGLICNRKFHFSHLCEIWHTKKKRAGREFFFVF